jgi:hypothetical protein
MIEQRHETERLEDILREIEREAVDRWARGRPAGPARNEDHHENAASPRPK